jgi:two-component system LytT family sensor kinase
MGNVAAAGKYNVLISTGMWVLIGFILLVFQPLSWGVRIPEVFVYKQLAHLVLMICCYYFNAKIVVPRTLFRDRIWLFIVWIVAATALALTANELISKELHVFEAMAKAIGHNPPKRPRYSIDFFITMTSLLTLGVSTSVAAFSRWQRDALLRQELEKEKVKSELSFLKAQINPHFFFNTLNNIYSLSFIDVPASQDALLKLSRMMRYLLYETQNDTTMLSKELSFVRDYIELMKLRMQEKTKLIYREPAHYEDVQVAPMLLLPYIENAFKHGISAVGDNELLIDISFAGRELTLLVENKIHRKNNIDQHFQESSGIGLQNTLRRLELLYPEKYALDIIEDKETEQYRVHLKLNLS